MDTVIKDTNILLDLYKTGLIRHCQQLGISFHTTNFVINEIIEAEQWHFFEGFIANGFLVVDTFEGEDFYTLSLEASNYRTFSNLSTTDSSVMLLAERYQCRLLTSDRKLRTQAEMRGIQVNGLLWLSEQLVEHNIVSPADMVEYLKKYKDCNERAPQKETDALINKYKNKK